MSALVSTRVPTRVVHPAGRTSSAQRIDLREPLPRVAMPAASRGTGVDQSRVLDDGLPAPAPPAELRGFLQDASICGFPLRSAVEHQRHETAQETHALLMEHERRAPPHHRGGIQAHPVRHRPDLRSASRAAPVPVEASLPTQEPRHTPDDRALAMAGQRAGVEAGWSPSRSRVTFYAEALRIQPCEESLVTYVLTNRSHSRANGAPRLWMGRDIRIQYRPPTARCACWTSGKEGPP